MLGSTEWASPTAIWLLALLCWTNYDKRAVWCHRALCFTWPDDHQKSLWHAHVWFHDRNGRTSPQWYGTLCSSMCPFRFTQLHKSTINWTGTSIIAVNEAITAHLLHNGYQQTIWTLWRLQAMWWFISWPVGEPNASSSIWLCSTYTKQGPCMAFAAQGIEIATTSKAARKPCPAQWHLCSRLDGRHQVG